MKIKNLSVEELKERKKEIEENINNLRREYNSISDSLIKQNGALKKIDEALDSKLLKLEHIGELLETFPETNIKRQLLDTVLKDFNLTTGGYFPETEQTCIKIMLYRNNDKHLEKVYNGIIKLLPYIKPLKNGKKTFSIFEHTLSYHESYFLTVTDDNMFEVTTHREYRDPLYSNKDLMKVLKYIQKNYYYEI